MVARAAHRHPHPPLTGTARPERRPTAARLALGAVLALAGLGLVACSGSADATADPKPPAEGATTPGDNAATTAGPPLGSRDTVADPTQTSLSGVGPAEVSTATVTAPPATFVVPDIPAAAVAEICAGTQQIVEADAKIGDLLGPALAADASTEADAALLAALAQAKPLIDQAQAGYDRMAVVLPGELATDAVAVRDATLTFYGAVTASQTMDGLIAVIGQAQTYSDSAKESAARLDATTRETCDQSLYNS
ncbi:MAG: hypothetical protein IT196_16260 [Acidimicrobiales bacterium]|nr:hypothetical protein [Acidimicrobiales bacterium]